MTEEVKNIPVEKNPEIPKKEPIEKVQNRVYKEAEFNAFLDMLRGEAVHHWSQIAKILGVDGSTVTEWKRLPQAQKAIRDGIEQTLENMTKSGKDDWRMWESKIKMLGLSPVEKADLTSNGETLNVGVVSYLPKEKSDE